MKNAKVPDQDIKETNRTCARRRAVSKRKEVEELIVSAQMRGLIGAKIVELINLEGIANNQKMIAARLGIDQPRVSRLMNCKIDKFSTERLMIIALKLGGTLSLTIEPTHYSKNLESENLSSPLVFGPDLLQFSDHKQVAH